MARTPTIRYFESRKGYYCQWQGKQHCLSAGKKDEPNGDCYKRAVQRFSELMHRTEAATAEDNNLVITVIDRYAQHLKHHGKTASLGMFRQSMTPAIADIGGLKIKELKVLHVQDFLDRMGSDRGANPNGVAKKWSDTTKGMFVARLLLALNWAVGQGMITKHSISKKALGLSGNTSRGQETIITADEHERMVAAAPCNFADLLRVLWATGARPAEIYRVTAAHYDRAHRCLIHRAKPATGDYKHKTARTGKDRVIYLPAECAAIVERLIAQYPTGYLFRSRGGAVWNNNTVARKLIRLRKKLGMEKMIPYGYRHSFATRWLLNAGSIKVLADLLGNSVAMIERHYGHLQVDKNRMHELLAQFGK